MIMKMIFKVATASILLGAISSTALSATVVMEKRSTSFSIDGGNGATNGRQVYLWNTNTSNVNQQWEEISISGGYTQFKKVGTNHCLDGNGGGSRGQVVHLWGCNSGNKNQHWEKKPMSGGYTRLKKRGVSFSLDCKGGGARNQTCHLWNSQDSNINQHFMLTTVGGGGGGGGGQFGLDPNDDPWENFDLSEWKLDTPAGDSSSSDCRAQATEPFEYTNFPSRSEPYFFTHSDGGMRFVTSIGGATTGVSCSSRTRS
jgi:hypothetical protein